MKRKWTGIMSKDLTSGYGSVLHKGEEVIVWKKRVLPRDGKTWNGEYEYHYTRKSDGMGLIRCYQFRLEGQEDSSSQ